MPEFWSTLGNTIWYALLIVALISYLFALFAVVFFWTPPHTWALATRYRDDYARAGVPMLPVVAPPTRVAVVSMFREMSEP